MIDSLLATPWNGVFVGITSVLLDLLLTEIQVSSDLDLYDLFKKTRSNDWNGYICSIKT
jgi:hypothetical protein